MKHILSVPTGGFDLVRYEDYLHEEASRIERLVDGEGLLTIDRFTLSGPGSFHDARLEKMSIVNRGNSAGVEVELLLKGPYFDRHFDLHYSAVLSCEVGGRGVDRDLLIHEIRIEEKELLAHEFLFDGGARIEILSGGLRFREALLAT